MSPCPWCEYLKHLYSKDFEAEIRQYIDSLSQDIKADDETIKARLSACSSCEDCKNGMCRYCGCFVAARAAKKQLSCPKPSEPRWTNIHGQAIYDDFEEQL